MVLAADCIRREIDRPKSRPGGGIESAFLVGERGHESDDEEGEGMGGDRGGEIDDEGGSDGGEDTRDGDERTRGNARQGTGGRGGRIIARAPMGLRLRWMIEGKGPPWAQR